MKKKIISTFLVSFCLSSTVFANPSQKTPDIPESKGECSVLAGVMVGLGMAMGVSPEMIENAENSTFFRCVSGEKKSIYMIIKKMVAMVHEYNQIRQDCAFQVGLESSKGTLMSTSSNDKKIEDCITQKMKLNK